MAGFDFFTQPAVPNIDVRLFGEAAEAGTKIGSSIPTDLTAAITGAQQGLTLGEKTLANEQQLDLNAARIEAQQTDTQIKQLQLKLDQDTFDQQQQLLLSDLQAKQAAVNGRNKLFGTADQPGYMSSPTANKDQILNDPEVQAYLTTNPSARNGVYGRMAQEGALTPDEQSALFAADDFKAAQENEFRKHLEELKQQKKMGDNLDNAVAKMYDQAPGIQAAINAGKLKLEDVADPDTVQVFPQGQKNFKEDGTLDTSKKDNPPIVDKPISSFDVVVNGKNTGIPISTTEFSHLQAFRRAYWGKYGPPAQKPPQQEAPANLVTQGEPGMAGKFWDTLQSGWGAIRDTLVPSAPEAGPAVPAAPGTAQYTTETPPPVGMSVPVAATNQPMYRINPTSTSPIVDQAFNKIASNPDLQSRLIQRNIAAKTQTAGAAPPIPGAPMATALSLGPTLIEQGIQGAKKAVTTLLSPATKADQAYSEISEPAKKYVEKGVLEKVEKEPLLQDLSPLHKAVAAAESGGDKNAQSPTGPKGFFQLSKAAAKDMGVDRTKPEQNVAGGVKYLDSMLTRYNGNEMAALLAYNAGPSVVDSILDLVGASTYEDLVYGLNYLYEKGYYPGLLTKGKLQEASQYPLKVAAYKEAFEAMNRG